jgi:nitrogenase molybdenum-iron protein alpha/beta subunit
MTGDMVLAIVTIGVCAVGLFVAIIGFTVNHVIKSFKDELHQDRIVRAETMKSFGEKVEKVEKFLEKISDEIFKRLNAAEKSVNALWHEHNLIKEAGTCGLHFYKRKDDSEEDGTI